MKWNYISVLWKKNTIAHNFMKIATSSFEKNLARNIMTTNEEWMKSLSTEDFARILNCNHCPENPHDFKDTCSGNCEAFIKWLKTERI